MLRASTKSSRLDDQQQPMLTNAMLNEKVKVISKAMNRRDGLLNGLISDVEAMDSRHMDGLKELRDGIAGIVKQDICESFNAQTAAINEAIVRVETGLASAVQTNSASTLNQIAASELKQEELEQSLTDIRDQLQVKLTGECQATRDLLESSLSAISTKIVDDVKSNRMQLAAAIDDKLSKIEHQFEDRMCKVLRYVKSLEEKVDSQSKSVLERSNEDRARTQQHEDRISTFQHNMEDLIFKSLGNIVREMNQQNAGNKELIKEMSSDLAKRISTSSKQSDDSKKEVLKLQQENGQLKEVIKMMKVEMQKVHEQRSTVTASEYQYSEAPETAMSVRSMPVSYHHHQQDLRRPDDSRKLLEMSNKLQAKIRSMQKQIDSQRVLAEKVDKGVQCKVLQPIVSNQPQYNCNPALKQVASFQMPKVSPQKIVRILRPPRRRIRNFNIQDG